MPISADQSAVLEMLLTGGQSYEDLDDLFGLGEGETRERARAALEELGGADPDRNVGLTDYLLGQADPIGRADAVRHLRQDAPDRELADKIVTELATLFPAAELPKLPQAPSGSRFGGRQAPPRPGRPASRFPPRRARASPPGRRALIAALGGMGILLVVVVLAVAGVFSGEDEPTNAGATEETAQNPEARSTPPLPSRTARRSARCPLRRPAVARRAAPRWSASPRERSPILISF